MEATEASTKCCSLKHLLYTYGLNPWKIVVKGIVFNNVTGFTPATSSQKTYFPDRILTRDAKQVHLEHTKQFFVAHLVL